MTLITTNFEQHTYLEFLVWEIFTNYFTSAILVIIYVQLEIMLVKPNYNLFDVRLTRFGWTEKWPWEGLDSPGREYSYICLYICPGPNETR